MTPKDHILRAVLHCFDLPVRSQESTPQPTGKINLGMHTIPLIKPLFGLSNLWTQLAVPQEHCCGWEFLIGTHEDEKEWRWCFPQWWWGIHGCIGPIPSTSRRILWDHTGRSYFFCPSSHCSSIHQRATCANHKAVNQANSNRKNLEATGVGACACARHGCFVPHSVVDFQKGER